MFVRIQEKTIYYWLTRNNKFFININLRIMRNCLFRSPQTIHGWIHHFMSSTLPLFLWTLTPNCLWVVILRFFFQQVHIICSYILKLNLWFFSNIFDFSLILLFISCGWSQQTHSSRHSRSVSGVLSSRSKRWPVKSSTERIWKISMLSWSTVHIFSDRSHFSIMCRTDCLRNLNSNPSSSRDVLVVYLPSFIKDIGRLHVLRCCVLSQAGKKHRCLWVVIPRTALAVEEIRTIHRGYDTVLPAVIDEYGALVNWWCGGRTRKKLWKRNFLQCHFVHHEPHMK
jgi:hypothetical protein